MDKLQKLNGSRCSILLECQLQGGYNIRFCIANCLLFRREVDGLFKILDKDLDGKLSFSEFLGEESHIERIFRTMDKNNDGFVSKEVI